ncbi:hypothetical protein EF888_18765 [Silicimonas algicola]|uniref:BrnA antitoxin of type II toxin-antitoxin system n=1 Tax=Silicimonas algicola TaxID=1826607 RepID=A0A316FZJ7_9RHOB|nr:BrnA antitoxin family protein [Silicimonas algicola]AZQ68992.1 hypothetical protein EF888_18765 [Silicimonas algicola]PWK54124.1 BrnA antitoxin of type II toxin-antitoxin system [Silicimonas algicola]
MTGTTAQKTFRQTQTARMARRRLSRHLEGLESDQGLWARVQTVAPEAWATLEEDIWCDEPKVKITLRIDASVAKFYRAMGPGYQARMNRVLASFALMRIGEVEREARSLRELLDSYGPEVSDRLRQAWSEVPDVFKEALGVEAEFWDRWLST